MTFDFFNPSHLAFGSKLTKAFNQLNRVCLDAEDALVDLQRVYEVYTQYVNRNYPCPVPNRPDAPCRTNELFDLINDVQTIKELRLDDEGVLHCSLNIFKRNTNRITVASGSTELKEGYIFYTSSVSNQNYTRELQFVEDYSEGKGNFVFEYRIDKDNNINIIGDSTNYFYPGDFDHICGMEYANDITFEDGKYTAEDEECIVCVGHGGSGDTDRKLQVKINDTVKFYVNAKNQKNFCVVYLKPDDVLSGDMTRAFKVKYLANEVPIPEPVERQYPAWVDHIIYTSVTGEETLNPDMGDFFEGGTLGIQGDGSSDNLASYTIYLSRTVVNQHQISFTYAGTPGSYFKSSGSGQSSTLAYGDSQGLEHDTTVYLPSGTQHLILKASRYWSYPNYYTASMYLKNFVWEVS